MLFVTAAGNSGTNNDISPVYPANFNLSNVISVAAMDNQGNLSSFSNYGLNTVDIAAPGKDIISTTPGNGYGYLSGTSMSAAYASGVAALVKSKNPAMTASQIKEQIKATATSSSNISDKIQNGRVLNAYYALGDQQTLTGETSLTVNDTNEPPQDTDQYAAWKQNLSNTASADSQASMLGYSNGKMYNDYLEYVVAYNGRFTIGTTGGNPDNANDNYKRMLYGHPSPWSSYTSLKVDGSNYYFSPQSVNQDSSNLSTTATQNINGVNIVQELKLVTNSNTGKADTVQIKYTATNQGASSHTVGTRIMMDTMLGNNDAAPFRIPGYGAVTTELELTGSNIPDYWQAFDSLTNPSVIAQGTLLRTENKPDKVQFTNWGRVYNTMWDYTIRPGSANGDSAVSVYWNPLTLQPGESKTYVTYYGLSEFMQDLRGNIGLTLNRIPSIEATTSGYYPNPIAVTGYIINNGNAMLNNVKAKITLPSGMRVYDDQIELSIGSIGVGTTRDFAWDVILPEFQTETTLNYTVEVSADNTDTKSLSYSFTVPATKVSSEALRYYEGAKYSIGAYNILTGQSTAIVDPVDAATGNFIQNNTDISVSGYNPIPFNRFYNSVDNWSGNLGRNWHNNYEIKLTTLSDEKVSIKFDDGRIEEYTKDQSGIYQPMLGKYGVVHFIDGQGYNLIQKDKTKYSFDLAGSLKAIQDVSGNITSLTYDSAKLASVNNDCGSLQFQYSGDLLSKVTDNTGRTVEYSYTAGNLTAFKDVDGNLSTFVYDENNRLTVIIDPAGNAKVTNVYDDRNRVLKQTMADGTVNTMSYDDTNKTTTLTDRNGAQTIYKWDDKFRIYETVYINGNEKAVFNNLSQKTAFTDKNGNTYYYEYDINGNITKETNPFGEITEYTYDSNNHVTSIKKPDGSIYIYNYDANGNMTVAKDPLGRELKIEYNAKALPVKINLPDGSFSEVQYDERGNATVVKDPLGNASSFIYDTSNRVISITKPEGNKVEFEYTPKGKVKRTIFSDGTYIITTYDVRGLVSEETDPNGGITKYSYNSIGKMIEKIDPAGGVTKYEYDSMWNVSKVTLPDGSITTYNYNRANQLEIVKDAEGHVTTLEHDALNNVTKVTDPKGGISQFSYDALSRLVQTVNANNAVTKLEYRYDGKISKVLDALNGATEYTYDTAGQLVSVKDALGNTSAYTYNALGLVATVKDAKGAETKYEYNSNGNVTKATKPDGSFDTLSYDKNGNLTKVVDAKGNMSLYSYDNMDRLTKIQNPIGGTKSVSYTKTGKVATLTDENNNTTTYKYNSLDRLVEVVDAKDNKTKYSYDAVGNLTEVHRFGGITQETINIMKLDKDSPAYQASNNELVTKYQYDRLGHVTQETNPAGKVVVYSYDSNGNLVSKTDRDGFVTKFEYDAVNNLKKTVYNDGKKVEYQYNPLNQVVGMTDWLGTNMFELDSLGRVLKATNYQNQVLEYKWSAIGEKESIKYPDGSMVKYEYDLMGRLTKVNDAKNKTATYNYDALGNVVEKLLPNGYKTQYSYDELQRLKSMVNYDANGNLVENYSYQYDAAGNMVKSNKNSKESLYKYDGLNQLQEISKPDKTLEKYFYDTLGNRVRLETWKNGTYRYSADFKYDNLDRLIQVTGKGYNVLGNDEYSPHGINLHYDQRGNIVETSTDETKIQQFTFDASNRLVQAINKKGEKSSFTYDGFGRRVGMTYDVNPSENIVAELSYLHDDTKPYDNVLTISGTNVDERNRQYTYGLEMLSVDTTKQDGSSNRLYYLHDELGSPIKLMDEAGLVGAKFEYDEFGRPVKPNNVENWDKKGNVFSFTGYQLDASTGLMYAQARYYMPEIGRFINEDSYKGANLDPQSLNLYVYVTNNPLKYIDPTGNMKWSQIDDLAYGVKDSVGDTIEGLFSWDTYLGMWELGKAICNGDLSASELISSIAQSAIEPVTHVWNNADDVFLGDPCDEEVRTYGKNTGDLLLSVAGSSAAIKAVVKVAPKLSKLLNSLQKVTPKAVNIGSPKLVKGSTWERNVLNSFEGGRAVEKTFGGGTKLYRIGDKNGGFWTTDQLPATEFEWRVKYAIKQEYGNNASNIYEINIPKGSSITGLDGKVGSQGMGLYGGGNQVYIDFNSIPESWISVTNIK